MFLCGSLEPGRDGVGDYTRRLASEFINSGIEAQAIALNDKHITHNVIENQDAYGVSLPVLRISSICQPRERFDRAGEWIEKHDPQWLSLQFVLFSFHSKGVPVSISRWLKKLGKDRHWHIMFHELWVGMNTSSSVKHKYWGQLQKLLIKRLLVKLRPKVIHTQTMLYLEELVKLGFKVEHLPLFGSIPVDDDIDKHFKNPPAVSDVSKELRLVLFGSIHPDAPIEKFSIQMSVLAQANNIRISLIIIGRSGPEQTRWAKVWETAGVPVTIMGEQLAPYISDILKKATIGISTTPIALAEKSSTIVTMLEHGLPVLCVSAPWNNGSTSKNILLAGVFDYQHVDFQAFFNDKCQLSPGSRVRDVSLQMIRSLEAHGEKLNT